MADQKNLILAIVISVTILLGWQFLIEAPKQAERQAALEAQQAQEEQAGSPEGVAPVTGDPGAGDLTDQLMAEPVSRDAALAEAPRVRIDTPRLHGSLSLVGARVDDLTLADYHETPDPSSPEIVLLSPRGAPSPYYADFGWVAQSGIAVPGPTTEWSTDAEVLEPGAPVLLTWENGQGLTFEREIAVDDEYMFTVTDRVVNDSGEAVTMAPYGRVLRFGTPDTLGFFILHEGPYGVFEETLREYGYGDLRDGDDTAETTTGGWLGFTDKYWLVALVPDQETQVETDFRHVAPSGEDRYLATYRGPDQMVPAGGAIETTGRLFAGAKEVRVVDMYETELGIANFDLAIDFGWFYFMTKPFFYALQWINGIVGNFGVAILIFTVLIKLVFFPLANKSYSAMSKMKALQPQMTQIRERFGDDRQRMNMEMMELYKREKVNPASGCLPILIQIPVFFALYKVLFVTIEMRHAPFFGWIQDLSAPDPTSIFNLFGLLPFTPPDILMIGVWPLIMGVSMYLQQKLNPAPADPIQQKIFMALPIVFTFILAGFPAGLVIYWAWNNTLSIAQQWVIMRRHGVKIGGGVDKPAHAPPSATRKKKKGEADAEEGADDGAEPETVEATATEVPANEAEPATEDEKAAAPAPAPAPAPKKTAVSSAPRKKKAGGGGRGRRK
ncbi:MAG: membrane protein insertase YidC [Alphaproteobacteria bacterium]|jgi:YidC/Oxa1 family membrane protein insertase|nr:membrane protein insertase YidC [Alphaproteobacteria bacterium]